MDEEGTGTGLSGVIFIFKDRPQAEPSDDDVRPPRKPKPKVKSQTVAGIALPGLAEMLNKNNANKADVVSAVFSQWLFGYLLCVQFKTSKRKWLINKRAAVLLTRVENG